MNERAQELLYKRQAQAQWEYEQARAEQSRRHLGVFIREAWEHIEQGVPFLDNWHLDCISEHLEAVERGDIKRLIINIPPRCAKSTLVSVCFPAWLWLRQPELRMMTASYDKELAIRDSIRARILFDTPWYKTLNERKGAPIFRMRGAAPALSRLKDSEHWYQNDKGGQRLALSVGGPSTGKGGNLLIIDDPQDPRDPYSEALRAQTIFWNDQIMSTRLDNPSQAVKIIIMQRLHCFDLTGHEIAKDIGYEHVRLPMMFERDRPCVTSLGIVDPRTEDGELLCPDRFDAVSVDALEKGLGIYGVAGQLQQNPLPEGGGIWKLPWWKRWGSPEHPSLPQFDSITLSVDANFDKTEDGSYVVAQVWGDCGPDDYLLDQFRERIDFVSTEQVIVDMLAKYKSLRMGIGAKLVEKKANGAAIINRLSLVHGGFIPIIPGESKVARAYAVAPMISGGNVWIPYDAPWVYDFLQETSNFPKFGSDDQVDAASQYLRWKRLDDGTVEREQHKSVFLKWAGTDIAKFRGIRRR